MYYLWLDEAQTGPFTLQQVQSLWKEGKITALTLFWQEGKSDWQPLSTIQSVVEPLPSGINPAIATLDQTVAVSPPVTAGTNAEDVQWTGHPTLWKWTMLFILGLFLCVAPAAVFLFFPPFVLFGLVTLPVAAIILGYIHFTRNSTRYTVTNKRVSMESGIFTKTSRELRIQDIRSIAAHINFLGYGDIEFSSASDEVDVTFTAVASAATVRDLVKKLQA